MSSPKPAKQDTKGGKGESKNAKIAPEKSNAEEQKSSDAKNKKNVEATKKDTVVSTLDDKAESQKTGKDKKQPDDLSTKNEEKCQEKKVEKRDILKLLEECDRSGELKKRKGTEEKCCTWHKYVFYALPLAAYLPWLLRMTKCPPKCCPPRYCCPSTCQPFCPPSKLACGPKTTGCPRLCSPEPDPCGETKEPKCKEQDKYSI
uniref:Uncharacterized protein n=1 Tax=Lygus hesperus TaxID=30085 RepID=A0A0A9YAU3_LYGHE